MDTEFIYHLITNSEWEKISQNEYYSPESLDTEGFIHFSQKNQIPDVIERYYKNIQDLMILKIDINKLESKLLYEQVIDHGIFPHLYGRLNLNAVIGVYSITVDNNNQFLWSEIN